MPKVNKYGKVDVLGLTDFLCGLDKNGNSKNFTAEALAYFIDNEILPSRNVSSTKVVHGPSIDFLNLPANSTQDQINLFLVQKIVELQQEINVLKNN